IGNGSWLNMVYGEYQYWWNIDPCSVEVEMTDPCDNSKIWAPNSTYSISATASDTDKYCRRYRSSPGSPWGAWGSWTETGDSIKIWWSGTSGLFQNNDFTDATVNPVPAACFKTTTLQMRPSIISQLIPLQHRILSHVMQMTTGQILSTET
ncbi:MAG: hypothetical protein ACYSWP_14145, partial [Planctomycetota bacterium]